MTKEPEDLGIKMGTPEEVYWTSVKELTEMQLKHLEKELKDIDINKEGTEKSIKLNKAIIEMADSKIKEEKCM